MVTVQPNSTDEGETDYFILGKVDGCHAIDQIVDIIQEHFPIRFKTLEKAHFYVKALTQQHGQLDVLKSEVINSRIMQIRSYLTFSNRF